MTVKLFTRHGNLVRVAEIPCSEAPENMSWKGRMFRNDFQQDASWQRYTETDCYGLPDEDENCPTAR